MPTTYEFVVETLDFFEGCNDDPDIIDTSGWDTLAQATAYANRCNEPWRICLRRDTGNDIEGLTDRFYAYPDERGFLPMRMETCSGAEDGPTVPAGFRGIIFPKDQR